MEGQRNSKKVEPLYKYNFSAYDKKHSKWKFRRIVFQMLFILALICSCIAVVVLIITPEDDPNFFYISIVDLVFLMIAFILVLVQRYNKAPVLDDFKERIQ